ncbi:hypothetical protein QF042_000645 [Pedobacter sp. W3I1]|uniref:Wzz/FepE/Etk N-terminal domain-containing protein n=1 Tax=Pedobacter sp. W3I1 TaxID=3042291 RepID=UPI00278555EE|nr:Wzz/FepE/Etk N-terminal domain-containing protein [Pedobacter sp. W3I1]MDQ0637080.1 hypothetical protein [Pedobacter sp. W3I1]
MSNLSERIMTHDVEEDESINLKEIFNKLLDKWAWFVCSILLCLIIAFIYTRYTPPVYQINAKLLVNDDDKGGSLGKQAGALMDLGGLMGAKNSVDNEVEILKTRFLMEQVVRKMQLNITYSRKTDFVSRELYNAPFKINILKGIDTIKATKLDVVKLASNKLRVSTRDFEKTIKWNEEFAVNGIGIINIEPTPFGMEENKEYFTLINSIDERVAALMNQLSVGVSNKQVSIIDLGLSYALTPKR